MIGYDWNGKFYMLQIEQNEEKQKWIEEHKRYFTDQRFDKIIKNSYNRTRYATVILEDIQQTHNISAAIRSAECFGVQDVHIIEQKFRYSLSNSVAKGAEEWLDVYRYKDTQSCYKNLKERGYKIYATTPHAQDKYIYEVDLSDKVALAFGTEHSGLSDEALEHADGFVKIPMYGFTESFNISVSVALCLYDVARRLRSSEFSWSLSESDILDLQIAWIKRNLR